jgi:hypothetical protein
MVGLALKKGLGEEKTVVLEWQNPCPVGIFRAGYQVVEQCL